MILWSIARIQSLTQNIISISPLQEIVTAMNQYFQKPVKVLPTETYMVVVSFNGGSSYLYSGGLECVKANTDGGQSVIFKFESDGDDQQINVMEEGVIPSIYFNTL